ncbi:TonB-dependent receptor plug domain-containing protein [Marinicauda salina]|uniref:TonB-dependent receptor plug domain-containing protein n=1 Tax=Marinicauda salina TaxID=2135793 RepID=UPI001E4ACC74|nr:TonB-dependent receptor [Marinicauda salina]
MSNWDKERLLRSSVLAGFAAFSLSAGAAFAQEEEPVETTEEQEEQQAETGERIVVTGSLLRRDEFTSSAPIQVVTAEAATLEGLIDTAEILQSTSVASGSVQFNNQFGGFIVQGGTGVNSISLRGLGAQRSLVLLNGRRPGPAGVRGQVGAFDLNVIPSSIVQRAEILKDGASSIYGSDAVAGVVNLITRDSVERPELNFTINQPFESGGESWEASGAFGLNFDRGNIVFAGQYQLREDLSVGDRDYLSCQQDLIRGADGSFIDREDRSVLGGTNLGGCSNIYFNTVIDAFTGLRYIPAPDGVTIGPIPGYRPRANESYAVGDPNEAFYEDVLNDPRYASSDAINRQERFSLFASSNFNLDILGGVDWENEFLFTRRKTESEQWRQFFPLIGSAPLAGFGLAYANDPTYTPAFLLSQPVTIWPSNNEITVDYYSFSSQLNGDLGANWSWSLTGTYSYSDGTYEGNDILNSESGDVQFDPDAPTYDPFSPEFLSGNYSDEFYNRLTHWSEGNTIYEQVVINGVITGELMQLPAGPLGLAVGAEYRNFSIEDTPDPLSQAGELWGTTSALITEGEDTVAEAFAEVEIPVIAGRPFIEEFTLNASGRVFEYDSYGNDSVWKGGFNWQITPLVRLRGTKGISYRAPALFELFLGNQTGFLGQTAIDPCVDWGNSTNENIRDNCAADGVPSTYTGVGSSATIVSGGGAGVLEAETSEAETLGLIFTPTQLNLSLALDYFDIEVNDQVTQLGAGAILAGCYGADNFPNEFCNLFDRNPGSDPVAPYNITEVRDSFVNINQQVTSGLDLTVRYEHEFDFGELLIEGQGTWTFEDVTFLFDPSLASGFDTNDFNGSIGDPDFVANTRVQFQRGDWTFSWFSDIISRTSNIDFANVDFNYFGQVGTRKLHAETTIYHDASVRWQGETISILAGVSNVFDEEPPIVSTGAATRRGNIPLVGSQYDLRGRTGFLRINKTF